MTEKSCTKCGEPKPLTDYNSQTDRHGKVRFRGECKECQYARNRKSAKAWYAVNAEAHKQNVTKQRRARNAKD